VALHRVTTPNAGWSGEIGGVQFTHGVAEINDDTHPNVLGYCLNAGYSVAPLDEDKDLDGVSDGTQVHPGATGQSVPVPPAGAPSTVPVDDPAKTEGTSTNPDARALGDAGKPPVEAADPKKTNTRPTRRHGATASEGDIK
jgi:hypothetical protein